MVKYFKLPSQYFQVFFEKNNPSCIQCGKKIIHFNYIFPTNKFFISLQEKHIGHDVFPNDFFQGKMSGHLEWQPHWMQEESLFI